MSDESQIDSECGSCLFWKHDGKDDEPGERVGICRRYPPVSILTEMAEEEYDQADPWEGRAGLDCIYWVQPRTLELDWCGEYQKNGR